MSSFLAGIKVISDNISPRKKPDQLPRPSLQHVSKATRQEETPIELPNLPATATTTTSPYPSTPQKALTTTTITRSSSPSNDPSPSTLESSPPQTPTTAHPPATGVLPSWSHPSTTKWRILACCLTYLSNGLNDSAPGALLPYIEFHYSVTYAEVSTIWISNAGGFILAAFVTDLISRRLGRAKSLMLGELCAILSYVVAACTPPFPLLVLAYFGLGFGIALGLALNNVFCSNIANATVILGLAHGSYGIGGTVAPIIATAMVSRGIGWGRFYLIALGLRVMGFGAVGWAFWGFEKEKRGFGNGARERERESEEGKEGKRRCGMVGRAIKNRVTILGALLIFAYQGAEVAESGWFIQYLISYRKGDPRSVGYVTSGFWGGITLGRFVLTHVARRVGERRFVFIMGFGVIGFQILAWQIPHIIGSAVAVSILGLLLGPIYPCAQTVFTRLLPGSIQTSAISFIGSAGSSGGAIVPFITGLIAQKAGTAVLHPICIAAYVVMLVFCALLPRIPKRSE